MSVCCILVYRGLARDRHPRSAVRRHPGCGHGVYYGTIRAVMARLGNLFRLQISDVLWSSIRFLLELVPKAFTESRACHCCATKHRCIRHRARTHVTRQTPLLRRTVAAKHAYARDKKFGCELSQDIAASTRAAQQTARPTTKTTQEDKTWPQTTSPKPHRRR